LPDYEIICWNENNFDINSVDFVKEAITAKKWAFAADYIRLYAVFTQGGIYMDTDVIVKKSFDKFLEHSFFTSVEINSSGKTRKILLQSAIFGAEAGNPYIKDCMDWYKNKHFLLPDGSLFDKYIAPDIYAEVAEKYGFSKKDEYQELKDGMVIYPSNVFTRNWFNYTKEAHAIHWYLGSWIERTVFRKLVAFLFRLPFLLRHNVY